MYVTAGKAEGTFIFGMKGVPGMEGHDCKQLCFTTKETIFQYMAFWLRGLYPVSSYFDPVVAKKSLLLV